MKIKNRYILLLILVLSLMLALIPAFPASAEGTGILEIKKVDTVGVTLGGGSFLITPDPRTGTGSLAISDNDSNDADPTVGTILILSAELGIEYTVHDMPPDGHIAGGDQTLVLYDNNKITLTFDESMVSISAPTGVPQGGGFYVDVHITGAVDVNCVQFDLAFDPGVIRVRGIMNMPGSGVSDGNVGGTTLAVIGWSIFQQDGGKIRVLCQAPYAFPNPGGVNGDGTLATIIFDVIGDLDSTSPLTLSEVMTCNSLVQKSCPVFTASLNTVVTVPLMVETQAATDMTDSAASLHGQLLALPAGSNATLSFGFSRRHGGRYTPLTVMTATGPTLFSGNLTGLDPGTTYYFEARSTVGGNTVTGPEMTFTTGVAAVNINIDLQGGSRPDAGWAVPLTVKLFTPGTATPANVLTATPVYDFNLTTVKSRSTAMAQAGGITPGTYDISVVSPGCLTNVQRGVVIAGHSTDVNLGTLLEGNANDDNKINIQDFGILAAAYGKGVSDAGYDERADFDRSSRINITDFGLLATNYAKNSPIEIIAPIPVPSGTISIDSPATVSNNSTFTMTVNISQATDFAAYEFNLTFNDEVIQLDPSDESNPASVTEGHIASGNIAVAGWNYDPQGIPGNTIRLMGCLIPTGQGVSGSGYLVQLHFMAVGNGQSPLVISQVLSPGSLNLVPYCFDSSGNEIKIFVQNGTMTVTP